jgi:hypothetical protein
MQPERLARPYTRACPLWGIIQSTLRAVRTPNRGLRSPGGDVSGRKGDASRGSGTAALCCAGCYELFVPAAHKYTVIFGDYDKTVHRFSTTKILPLSWKRTNCKFKMVNVRTVFVLVKKTGDRLRTYERVSKKRKENNDGRPESMS